MGTMKKMTKEEYKRLQFIVETLVSTNELRIRFANKILDEARKQLEEKEE
jgi:hypothetical protein